MLYHNNRNYNDDYQSSERGNKMKKGLILTVATIAIMSFAVGCTKTKDDIKSDMQSAGDTVSKVVSEAGGVVSEAKDKTESIISDVISDMK